MFRSVVIPAIGCTLLAAAAAHVAVTAGMYATMCWQSLAGKIINDRFHANLERNA